MPRVIALGDVTMKTYDAIIVGTGQATGSLVPELTGMGLSVAVVERDRVGGTCVNWGCTPTKTIVASARVAHMARRGADFGVKTGEVSIDFARVMERQNAIRNGNSQGFERYLEKVVDFYRGNGVFTGPKEITVGNETLTAERIYIHTGTSARVPDVPGLDQIDYLDNRSILDLSELPKHLIVVGGSYIGLEFSQAFARFGSKVTILERGARLMPREDADVAAEIQQILESEGIEILCGTNLESVQKTRAGVCADIQRYGERASIEGSHVLFAVGRVPNTADLGLDVAGIATNERGFINVDETLQTNVPGVFAIGDVNGRGAFTHTSVHDGQIISHNLKGESWKVSDRTLIYSLYIDPPLGRVGLSEEQARKQCNNLLVACWPMNHISRAKEKDETAGIVKFMVDGDTERILGAAILGIGGDEIINMIAHWIAADKPYREFQRVVLNHPTVAELMPWILADLQPAEPEH